MPTTEERRDELKGVYVEASGCTRCPVLAAERRTVVFGAGHADADLLLVGEAPGRAEDEQGLPFAAAPGRLLSELLGEIGLERSQVYVTTLIKCRTPGNREPLPPELANCRAFLHRQLELVRPRVVCALGNFATRLLRDDPAGVTKVHGQVETRTIGPVTVRLLPVFHPAAALYATSLLDVLRADFARLPELLALPAPEPEAGPAPPVDEPATPEAPPPASGPTGAADAADERAPDEDEPDDDGGGQLGLF